MALLIVVTIVALAASTLAVALGLKSRSAVRRSATAEATLLAARGELAVQHRNNAELSQHLDGLRRYQSIVDAEAEAGAIIRAANEKATHVVQDAERAAADLRTQADALMTWARVSADAERSRASGEADALRRQAADVIGTATLEAETIVATARATANDIAGDALAARDKAREFQETAQAMRNIIDGYGDKYVVPASTAIDDLAEQFGFTKAGEFLKSAREASREMVRTGRAATCDYVEANRRETAIAFVLDAFNGKADTILADVRGDNIGTLQRRLRDSFAVVNHHGQAFRNARILPGYLAARMEEVHWSVATQELKERDREEQRLLRERIREEEKAQKEFERARREAQKEEEMLRRAMDKVKIEAARASDEQRAKFETQLSELQARLLSAEEKNRRALSMAQQTRSGYVYIISNVGSFGDGVYKIGLTRRLDPLDRVRELGDASVPFGFDVHALIRSDDAPSLEADLHRRFIEHKINKINPRKEFFRAALHDIRLEVERLGLTTQWTMAAECREWKETLAIENAIREKTIDAKKWAEDQLRQDVPFADEEVHGESVSAVSGHS